MPLQRMSRQQTREQKLRVQKIQVHKTQVQKIQTLVPLTLSHHLNLQKLDPQQPEDQRHPVVQRYQPPPGELL
ncbi:MAG: hypothetical protein HC825_00850 [Oscillatoriales cyanobacterium RM1_1_9]|nr:hypothetical protein [Oscillatoriales cyanobacterium SM2_3_0]NJO44778.1 hypothetical protein [Oscillatoriales cyanobacterium RM2_1_1]NJO70642.1 hypothetical protein [Oscillatoriales cyanobacterium RM1_1_9]